MLGGVRPADDRVRRWPYPYLGSLSISNDIDYCSFDFFEHFMRFCNTTNITPFGRGLGMEVTSSFFTFARPERQFGYHAGLSISSQPSMEAPRIGEYIAGGWIDANHAYGDFDEVGGFERGHAERYLEVISRHRGDVRVFINHGDACNAQCVGGPGAAHHDGDRKHSPAYHADLLGRAAPAFVTTSWHIVGDETKQSSHLRSRLQALRTLAQGLQHRRRAGAPAYNVLEPYILQDGTAVLAFTRLRGTGYNAPNLGSLNYQIELVDFDKLYASESSVIIYQHWGILYREARRCVSATVDDVVARPGILSGLRRIAREFHESRLWIAGTQRLLDYAYMVARTTVETGSDKGSYRVICKDEPENPERFFQGLTIYVDPAEPCSLTYKDRALAIVRNGPDRSGRYSVSVPLARMQSIW